MKKLLTFLAVTGALSASAADVRDLQGAGFALELARLCKASADAIQTLERFKALAMQANVRVNNGTIAQVDRAFEEGAQHAKEHKDKLNAESCKALFEGEGSVVSDYKGMNRVLENLLKMTGTSSNGSLRDKQALP